MDLWEAHADWWQDEFTDGADVEYVEQIIPLALDLLASAESVIDIGCGEGQIGRALVAAGVDRVVGFDPTVTQITVAAERAGGVHYGIGDAAAIPVADASMDAALACLVFEHIDSFEQALCEVARVLRPGGRFVFMLNHPLLQTPDSGWIDDQILEEKYWRVGPYLIEASTVEEVQKDVFIPFVHRPLHRYLNAMIDAGLVLDRMVEPAPPEAFQARASGFAESSAIPRLLVLIAHKA